MISQDISFEEQDNNKYVYIYYIITSSFLIPQVISTELNLEASLTFAKGDRYLGKTVDPKTRKTINVWRERPIGVWRIDSKQLQPTHRKVEDHFQYFLDVLEPKKSIIEKYLKPSEKDYKISFNVFWRPNDDWGSYEIQSDTLLRASQLCHYVEFALTNLP